MQALPFLLTTPKECNGLKTQRHTLSPMNLANHETNSCENQRPAGSFLCGWTPVIQEENINSQMKCIVSIHFCFLCISNDGIYLPTGKNKCKTIEIKQSGKNEKWNEFWIIVY